MTGRAPAARWLKISGTACALLLLAGCTRLELKLGRRIDVAQLPLSTMQAKLATSSGTVPASLSPGSKDQLVITLAQPDGTVLATPGKGKGKVLWSDFALVGDVVSVNAKNGNVTLAADPRVSDGKTGLIDITLPSHPGLHTTVTVPVRYDVRYNAICRGFNGNNGQDGSAGSDGLAGSPGSTDPGHPSPGGMGGAGSNGSNGSAGGNGDPGPDVLVELTMHSPAADGRPLVEARVTAQGRSSLYLIDPNGGALFVSSEGGSGGRGGRGGRGGHGGAGGTGSPSGSSGVDGTSGSDGLNGSDGAPGTVRLAYDPAAAAYVNIVEGTARNPLLQTEEPIAPFW